MVYLVVLVWSLGASIEDFQQKTNLDRQMMMVYGKKNITIFKKIFDMRLSYGWKCSQLEMLSSLFIVFLLLLFLQINLGIQYNQVAIKMGVTTMKKEANKR